MRLIKKFMVLSLVIMLFACKSDDDGNTFLLSYANMAGLYNLVYLNGNIDTTIEIQGIPVTAVTTIIGDTFQVETMFNENGTYSIDGEYRVTTTTTAGGNTETDTEIIVVDDTGTYQVDANDNTVTISSNQDEFDGTFDVTMFTPSEIRLVQEESFEQNGATIDSMIEFRFVRQ